MSISSIPAFHLSGLSNAKGKKDTFPASYRNEFAPGVFHIDMDVHFDPTVDNFPAGTVSIQTNMIDGAKGVFVANSIELINSYGKNNPTIYLTGLCNRVEDDSSAMTGCRYWLMVVNNTRNSSRSLDVIGFCIHDSNGNRIAYGANL